MAALAAVLPCDSGRAAVVVSEVLTIQPVVEPGWWNAPVYSRHSACGGWVQYLNLEVDGSLRVVTGTLGDPFAWFRVAEGDPVDLALVLGNVHFAYPGPQSILYGEAIPSRADGTWLFGWWSTHGWFEPYPRPDDCYGWVKFGVQEGRLVILEDAAALAGPGIITGTLTPVPEPRWAGVAGVVLLWCRRGRRERARN